MKPFQFQKFTIIQSPKVFKIGTDGVLLGALSSVKDAQKILEIGTGTGLVSLMIAQRNLLAEILAIDINEGAVDLAKENFKNSPFSERLKAQLVDYKKFKAENKFDLIISNPPYFEENTSEKHILARQQTQLNFENLIEKSAELLTENGEFSVIIPFDAGETFEKICLANGLLPSRKVKIFGIQNSAPKRWILEFGFEKVKIKEEDFTIEKMPRIYSEEYLFLTKDFHQFEK